MGDRANVVVMGGGSLVFLYAHWGGSDLAGRVVAALRRRARWDDPAYLTRIVFCEMIRGAQDAIGGETGYGIASVPQDNELGRPHIVLDTDRREVSLQDVETGEVIRSWPMGIVAEDGEGTLLAYWR